MRRPSSARGSRIDRATPSADTARRHLRTPITACRPRYVVSGVVRRGLEPVPPKISIALRVDSDVLAWFKTQGPGYQTRMNAVLRAFRDASI